ncbi:MAG TPA: DUF2723 domain-containing protein [Planctomycetota bacterium]|nr:DUF2723 domain-containing protein [Planctomycetota bacterium]
MRRFVVPGIPFLFSMVLSLSTAGSHVAWQDSGFFLVAVKELGVLYPPGFPLYLLLCKAWTLVLGGVDFTYAVHLFSATCAALAAGTLAVAAHDLLVTKGPLFHTVEDGGPLPEWVGVSIGCLAASGYTFWAAAILAKVYALYYLVLTLLIWRMVRADESGKPRDFTIVAALIGLAWQSHPSATNTGLALALFVAFHRRRIGVPGLLGRIALAAGCALGPLLLLPVLARGDSALRFGDPNSAAGLWDYLTGARFTGKAVNFGFEGVRVTGSLRYFWEEFLGVGVLLVALGVRRLWIENRRLLVGVLAWVLPVLVVTVLFKLEGQHDCWEMAAWIPLWLVAAVGMASVGKLREGAVVLALIGTTWAGVANRKDLSQRDYTLSEAMGHLQLDGLDPQAVLFLNADDTSASSLYLQRVKGVRPDVVIVQSTFLGPDPEGRPSWYDRALLRLHPDLQAPDYGRIAGRAAGSDPVEWAVAAWANANISPTRPMFFERPPGPEILRAGWTLVPAGHLLKMVSREDRRIDPKYWRSPVEPESLPAQFRRERGQYVEYRADEVRVRPEAYERRLLRELLRARKNLADWRALSGTAEGLERSVELYESILELDPWMRQDAGAVVPLARAYFALKRLDRAEPLLKSAVDLPLPPRIRGHLFVLLAEICEQGRRSDEAARWKVAALAVPELPDDLRRQLQGR